MSKQSKQDQSEAIRQTVNCPTCDGRGWQFEYEGGPTVACPDCTDGKIDMLRLLAVGAAVFWSAGLVPGGTDAADFLDGLLLVTP